MCMFKYTVTAMGEVYDPSSVVFQVLVRHPTIGNRKNQGLAAGKKIVGQVYYTYRMHI